MNETQTQDTSQSNFEIDVQQTVTSQPKLSMPDKYILISAVAKQRKIQADEARRLSSFLDVSEIQPIGKDVLKGSHYEMGPGETCELKIDFYQDGQKVKPKGMLLLQAKRGKLSPTRYELDGTKDSVFVRFSAPDETIRISVRALLEEFYRGKIHIHLDEKSET